MGKLKAILKSFLFAVFLVIGFSYLWEAHARSRAIEWSSEHSPDGNYMAKYTYIAPQTALVRLYDAKNGWILAERTFIHGEPVELTWLKDGLMYNTTDDSFFNMYTGIIRLPPTPFDRLVALLP